MKASSAARDLFLLILLLIFCGCAQLRRPPGDGSNRYLSPTAREIGAPYGSPENPNTTSQTIADMVAALASWLAA